MRWMKYVALLWLLAAGAAQAESAKIVKVLPYFLDEKGRHALKPSLYERDAYQALLRKKPNLRSGLRFEVQWKASGLKDISLRVEARGNLKGQAQAVVLEEPVKKKGLFGHWSSLCLKDEAYKKLGELTAWRATLWSGGHQVAEQKSYLW
ncbi:MAG: hypothetical protein NTW03_19945 [Verrucomicrobia bacterium]|nr:hypothetical protein [Verrucomicrobiota bacterium]